MKRIDIVAWIVFILLLASSSWLVSCTVGSAEHEHSATLDEYRDQLKLVAANAITNGDKTVDIQLKTLSDIGLEPPCPLFDLKARVNGRTVNVSSGGYRNDILNEKESCVLPHLAYVVATEERISTACNVDAGEFVALSVIQRLNIELTDASGTFAAVFRRTLPFKVTMLVTSPQDARVRTGEKVVLSFDPTPVSITQLQLVYEPDGGTLYTDTLKEGTDGYVLDDNELSFTMPQVQAGRGTLRVGMLPWTPLTVECQFSQCEASEPLAEKTPLICSTELEVIP